MYRGGSTKSENTIWRVSLSIFIYENESEKFLL